MYAAFKRMYKSSSKSCLDTYLYNTHEYIEIQEVLTKCLSLAGMR